MTIKKETAQEVPVQEQSSININQLRVKNELNPIPGCDADFISVNPFKSRKAVRDVDKNKLEIIIKGTLENNVLTEKEKEIAQEILNSLDGVLVIRATSILELCLKAVQYTSIKRINKEELVQEQYAGKCNYCGKNNEVTSPKGINHKFCMECGKPVIYQKILEF